MTPDIAIQTRDLTKRFGSVTALENLSLEIPAGCIYGFLGPNGAGKSTTIDILLDLVRPSAGTATVLGYDTQDSPVAVRERTGVLLDGFTPYAKLTGRQHVALAADAKDVDAEPTAVLERVELTDAMDRAAGGYSKGMTQRLGLAMALVGEPDLLILDEPSTGLDPHGVALMRDLIREENDRGATVCFSSHILDQVEAVCDRVGILDDGRLIADDDVATLHEAVGDDTVVRIRTAEPPTGVRDRITSIDAVSGVRIDGDELVVRCADDAATARVIAALERTDLAIESIETGGRSLERVFAAYTGG
ncbi:ABC transporter ATP-binding protein [Natrarchaeobius sp. A-rgal3]|uniref:ABC transporter ATP-binding protein n=1 Tax=Natrarchaeobius versutus TaxID=1679078 RepID=UPI00350EEA8A